MEFNFIFCFNFHKNTKIRFTKELFCICFKPTIVAILERTLIQPIPEHHLQLSNLNSMKSWTISFLLTFFTGILLAQCPPGDINLSTQAEVDDFANAYPNCFQTNANLTLDGSDITDLSGLSQLTLIGEDLNILNTSLTNLNGLDNITEILERLVIIFNPLLTDLTGLENVAGFPHFLQILFNDNLSSLAGLENMSLSNLDSLSIQENNLLSECSILNLCTFLNGGTSVFISNNAPGCNDDNEILDNCNTAFNTIEGYLIHDVNGNCTPDGGNEDSLALFMVEATDGTLIQQAITNTNGYYFFFADVGTYTINVNPPNDYWVSCLPNSMVTFNSSDETALLDLPLQPILDCPDMTADISSPGLQPCFENRYYVTYCNQGTIEATDVMVQVELDDLNTVTDASEDYTVVNGLLEFNIGTVGINECETITIWAFLDCSTTIGQTLCAEAHVFPDTLCTTPPGYNGADLQLEATCNSDEVQFSIKNTGTSAMTEAVNYIVIEDHIIMLNGTDDPLGIGEEHLLTLPANGSTYRLQVNQIANHPSPQNPTVAIEGCTADPQGAFSTGYFTMFPEYEASNAISVSCQEVVAAYDPNDKKASPKGYMDQHLIEANTELEYRIRFQNTGTATALNVVLIDTISPHLDLASFRPGTSSHPYEIEMEGDNLIRFVFDNIMLPDSNANEPASHGFVTFEIDQKPDNPIGTLLENYADIYFDFNDPVRTDTAWHTIGEDFIMDDCVIELTTQNEIDQFADYAFGGPVVDCGIYIKSGDFDPITNLDGLNEITTINGFLDIEQNGELSDLSGLQNLTTINGYLEINSNNALVNLSGLSNLTEVMGDLIIYFNNGLTSLLGLQNLIEISGELVLETNPNLTSISALSGLDPNSITGLTLVENYELSACHELFICAYLATGNPTLINDNGSGCNDEDEVIFFCTYVDDDNDGYYTDVDCDDTNPDINPGNEEVTYNGQDDDCDPTTLDDDLDQDGYPIADDCDDDNPDINPGNEEVVYNGQDDDCDPATLDDDLDQDGYPIADDCDDENPDINPGSEEVTYNGQDDDCDPATLDDDLDQDGYPIADDCDDENPDINPDAADIPNNGIDEDCDGQDNVVSAKDLHELQPQIAPNPVADWVTIQLHNPQKTEVSVWTITGQEVLTRSFRDEITIDISGLPDGVYLFRLFSANQSWTVRVLKF